MAPRRDKNGARIEQMRQIETDLKEKSVLIRFNLANPCPILVAAGSAKQIPLAPFSIIHQD